MHANARFLLFVMIGGFAALVNLVARIAINQVTGYDLAIVLAYPFGMLTAFLLNRLFVFVAHEGPWHGQLLRFTLVNLAAILQIFLVSILFARGIFPATGMTFHPETVAHAIGLISPTFTSYWAHRHFTFAGKRRSDTGRSPA